jgi:MerR family transcriptional regulator, light-induced transcriptional regulator
MDEERGHANGGATNGREPGPLHPIGVVARQTGLSSHVLRAWERRYGVVAPVRTAGGQRVYRDEDISRLRLLRALTEAGRNISQVALLPREQLERLVAEDVRASEQRPQAAAAAEYRSRCLVAAERLDGEAVHGALMRAVVSLRPTEFLGEVLMPLLREVGDRWHAGRMTPAQEHVVSMSARRVVSWLLDAYDAPAESPLLLVTTVSGEQHEFGALMVSIEALDLGWRVSYLGPSLPAEHIASAARRMSASAVALSVVNTGDDSGLDEVREVRVALPATVPVVVGGAGAAARRAYLEEAGVVVMTEQSELREWLAVQRGAAGGVA